MKFGTGWNTGEPIKELIIRLEEHCITALVALPPYMREQMTNKALMAVQATVLYETAVLKWAAFLSKSKLGLDLRSTVLRHTTTASIWE